MRAWHGDALAAARALYPLPDRLHRFALTRMLAEAAAAEAHARATGRMHPRWGDGSLMAAALRRRCVREPLLTDPRWCRCVALVYGTLAARQ